MVEGGIAIPLNQPINSGFQHPEIPFLLKDHLQILMQPIFKIKERGARSNGDSLLGTIDSRHNSPLLLLDVSKMIPVPKGCFFRENLNGLI